MSRNALFGAAVVVAFAGALACNSIAGIHDPVNGDGTPSSSGGVPEGGADTDGSTSGGPEASTSGGTDGSTSGGNDRFVGTWSTNAATQRVQNCPQATTVTNVAITVNVVRGASADQIKATNNLAPGCVLTLSISGDTATLLPGQTCEFTPSGDTVTYSYSTMTTFKVATSATAPGGLEAGEHIIATYTSTAGGFTCNYDEFELLNKQ